ncbi:MAG: DUF2304 domain-containing protein [Curvibacter sp.]|nr:MAG: DUF2304 domain-containing protein [Curvibacter sp.]
MAHLQITTSLLGIGLAVLILHLLRRDHLHLAHGLFWMLLAAAAAVLGLWPGLINLVASTLGIAYPPALLLLLGMLLLIVKALHADIQSTQLARELKRLNQRVAMLEVQWSASDARSCDR